MYIKYDFWYLHSNINEKLYMIGFLINDLFLIFRTKSINSHTATVCQRFTKYTFEARAVGRTWKESNQNRRGDTVCVSSFGTFQ